MHNSFKCDIIKYCPDFRVCVLQRKSRSIIKYILLVHVFIYWNSMCLNYIQTVFIPDVASILKVKWRELSILVTDCVGTICVRPTDLTADSQRNRVHPKYTNTQDLSKTFSLLLCVYSRQLASLLIVLAATSTDCWWCLHLKSWLILLLAMLHQS